MAEIAIFWALEDAVEDVLDTLVDAVIAGDGDAWPRLWTEVEPRLLATLRRPSVLGALCHREDERRNVFVEVMARLRADGYLRLRAYAEARRERPGMVFAAWLLVVAKRVAIDYMRAHEEYEDRRHVADASSPGAWRAIETLVADSRAAGARPSITAQGTVRELLEAARDLPVAQQAALAAWLTGSDHAEIAAALGVPTAKDAERVVRAALERLRRRFREERA